MLVGKLVRKRPAFGFIRCESGDEYFIHTTQLPEGQFNGLEEGTYFSFEGVEDPKGRGRRVRSVIILGANPDQTENQVGRRIVGKVDYLNVKRHFGYVVADNNERYFFHSSELRNTNLESLEPNDALEFTIAADPQGRSRVAIEIKMTDS